MSLVAVEKRKSEKKGQKEKQWTDKKEKKKDSSLRFQILIGNQTNPVTVAAPRYSRQPAQLQNPQILLVDWPIPSC